MYVLCNVLQYTVHVHVDLSMHCASFSCLLLKVGLSETISTSAARGAVEKWLLQVQDVMIKSVRDVIEESKDVSLL